MPDTMITEEQWELFLHKLHIWERRWVYKHEVVLLDKLNIEEIQLGDIERAVHDSEGAVAVLASFGTITPGSNRAE